MYSNKNFNLSKSVIQAVAEAMKSHTVPETEKEKKLAALAHPKDKITHADVLTGRGVKRKQDMEEMSSKEKMKKGFYTKEDTKLEEETPSKQQVKQAIGIARDKRYARGNVTGAVKAMNKLNPGLAQHPAVKNELQKQNEEADLAESHFEVGDKIKCKSSGKKGKIVKMDKEDGDADEKYYTIKREDGVMKKMAPNEMIKMNEAMSAYGRIDARFKKLSGRSMGDAAKEHGKEAERLQKEIDAQKAENERRKAAMKTEEVDQIDELSKTTLASYAKKAVPDARFKQGIGKDYEAVGKRKRDLGTKAMYARMGQKLRMKAKGREDGVVKAIDRLAKEEVDPIDYKVTSPGGKKKMIKTKDQAHKHFDSMAKTPGMKEEKDTPGNSYDHQCAIHVKHAKLGEGKTLFSQHAKPSDEGDIEWYDVMFEHGIEKKVPTTELEILVSESHHNHKKKGK